MVDNQIATLGITAADRVSLLASFGFDAAIPDLYPALLTGAAVVPVDVRAHGVAHAARELARHEVTVYHSTPTVVEDYCARNGQTFEWTEEGLRTRHVRPSFVDEPHTGATVWFNQANLFHVSSLGEEVSEVLLELYPEADLPRNAYFADGSPIPVADLDKIREVYDEVSYAFPWQDGDIMVINNMLMAHGREPFTGKRRILVAMTG
ncbi:TauD/TfdA family dioxygenase [Amycolatopsis sp. NPDC051128]|uniref:TauD/TfdA family dioxygenase n=1 Tax=Amycolatopsis sp. NPDC051128 TaxID=3155412 RepID=UPI003422E507